LLPAVPWRKPGLPADCAVFWNKLGLAVQSLEVAPHHDSSSFPAPTMFGAEHCGTSAGIGSLLPAVPWRKPGLPADGARSYPRRLGHPAQALELGARHEQSPEPCSAAVSCCWRGRSLGCADPCCSRCSATLGICSGPSLGPWRGHHRGLHWKSCGAGGLRNDTASFLQSEARISLLMRGWRSCCAACCASHSCQLPPHGRCGGKAAGRLGTARMRDHCNMQGKQKLCLHQLTKASSLAVSWQIVHMRCSEGSLEASCGVAWGTWLLLAAGLDVPSPAQSSSDTISHCKQRRRKAHSPPWRCSLQEAAKLWKSGSRELPTLPRGRACAAASTPGPRQASDTEASLRVPAPRAGW